MQNRISILCTRPLNTLLVNEVTHAAIDLDEFSFIETEPIQSITVQQKIEQALVKTATVVFTSMNAVEAVAFYHEGKKPDWNIYCIGTTTNKLVAKHFGQEKINGSANDATSLAELIVKGRHTGEVIFFCGDQRRDELPAILRKNDVAVTEIEVYQTISVPHKIDKVYHGILFFSPSAVASFFKNNELPDATILFAIGNTTATEIKKYSTNEIITSGEPGKENLVRKMLEYYTLGANRVNREW